MQIFPLTYPGVGDFPCGCGCNCPDCTGDAIVRVNGINYDEPADCDGSGSMAPSWNYWFTGETYTSGIYTKVEVTITCDPDDDCNFTITIDEEIQDAGGFYYRQYRYIGPLTWYCITDGPDTVFMFNEVTCDRISGSGSLTRSIASVWT